MSRFGNVALQTNLNSRQIVSRVALIFVQTKVEELSMKLNFDSILTNLYTATILSLDLGL